VQLRDFAAKQGWIVVAEYVDRESGAKSDRVEFQRMFADASKRKFDLVLFWASDRLSSISIIATLAKQERVRRSERTKAGLAIARSRGKRLGRAQLRANVAEIARLKAQGLSLRAIARRHWRWLCPPPAGLSGLADCAKNVLPEPSLTD
jgi:DNA invertase Pin-like site-specific DNA recombinase